MAASSKTDRTVVPYKRTAIAVGPENVTKFFQEELRRIEQTFGDLCDGSTQVLTVAPASPRRGMIVYAASPWNPGSGEGLYVYKGPATGWKFIV